MTEHVKMAGTVAHEAAEAVRTLNYLTYPADGYPGLVFPADVYEAVASLAVLADRLPQALAQMSTFLEKGVSSGRYEVHGGMFSGDPVAAIATVQGAFDDARSAISELARHLHDAQNALADVASGDLPDDGPEP